MALRCSTSGGSYPMKRYITSNSARLGRVGVLVFLALLLDHGFTSRLAAQTRTNLAGSVTSETMTVLWVARDRGLFRKHGLDMQFILMPRNPLAVAALLAGEIDAAIVGPGHVINAASSGVDLIGIANLNKSSTTGSPRDPKSSRRKISAVRASPSAALVPHHTCRLCWRCKISTLISLDQSSPSSRFREPR